MLEPRRANLPMSPINAVDNSFVDVHKDLSLSIRFDVHPTSTTDSAIYTDILGSRSSTRDDNFFYELLLPNTIVVSSVVKHK